MPRATEVRISKRVLWIGSEAYSLHNIGRASVKPVERKQTESKAVKWSIILWTAIWVWAWIAFSFSTSTYTRFILSVFFCFAGWLVGGQIVVVLVRMSMNRKYQLIIQAAGEPVSALTSTDTDALHELARKIMDTIDNPEVEFQIQINNVHYGDWILQIGHHNLGKDVRD